MQFAECRRPRRWKSVSIWAIMAAVLIALFGQATEVAYADDESRYWDLGVGCYFGGPHGVAELDVAMHDWLYLCFGNIGATEETTRLLNRLLKLNPELKIVIRVWPIMGIGDCKENRHQATFLHYLYKPGVREKLLANVREQVSVVLDHIDRPENVVGLTFLEELPGHFSAGPFMRPSAEGKVTWDLERFRSEIEAERGKPLVWDDETRLWWGRKWVQVINEIHAEMKKASQGRLVFYYQQTNHSSLDMVAEGTPISTRGLMPIHWTDIIKPGLCDGFFAYPNSRSIWERYVGLARDHGWLFFSQVSHPGFMRLCSWEECLELAKTKLPQNMGYFLYCQGDCAASRAWNADRDIPPGPEWNTRGVSVKLHSRRHLALEDVGREVLRRQPALRLRVDLPLDRAAPGSYIHPRVIVENSREASMYLNPDDAIARNATISLQTPEGFSLEPGTSPPATIRLGDLLPGEQRVADWWVSVSPAFEGEPPGPFILTGKAEGSPPTVARLSEDTSIPFALPHEIGVSGTQWTEAAYRLPVAATQPRIVIQTLRGPVRNPAVSDGYATMRYQGAMEAGTRLVIDPKSGARLLFEPLLDDDGASRSDPDDPSGFTASTDGYLVHRIAVSSPIKPLASLRVAISGKAAEGGQSLVVLRFKTAEGTKDMSVLVNRFAEQWREVAQTVQAPPEAVSLQNVFLYRFKSRGKVWYGPVKIQRAHAGDDGLDVSERLRGGFLTLSRGAFRTYTYTDDSPPSVRPRVRVQLELPEE